VPDVLKLIDIIVVDIDFLQIRHKQQQILLDFYNPIFLKSKNLQLRQQ